MPYFLFCHDGTPIRCVHTHEASPLRFLEVRSHAFHFLMCRILHMWPMNTNYSRLYTTTSGRIDSSTRHPHWCFQATLELSLNEFYVLLSYSGHRLPSRLLPPSPESMTMPRPGSTDIHLTMVTMVTATVYLNLVEAHPVSFIHILTRPQMAHICRHPHLLSTRRSRPASKHRCLDRPRCRPFIERRWILFHRG